MRNLSIATIGLTLLALIWPSQSQAVPSFARQTGMSCAACHTIFPELTAMGRNFKLHGYQLASVQKISDTDSTGNTRLSLSNTPPVSIMFQAANTWVAAQSDTVTVNTGTDTQGTVSLPSQFSIFYAGSVAPGLGAFVQATFQPSAGHFVFDNTDVRWAGDASLLGADLVYGLDLNNGPTIQDLWNSTPAWGFPDITPSFGNNPIQLAPVGPLIDNGLNGTVGGLGVYAMVNNLLYLEFDTYRPAIVASTPDNVIQGYAPYWRAALQQDFDDVNVMVGTFGMAADQLPLNAALFGPTDSVTDVGVDSQVQYIGEDHIVSLSGSWIHESADYNASNPGWAAAGADTPTGVLNHLKVSGTYFFRRLVGGTVSYFAYDGSPNTNLYADPAMAPGFSRNGSPNANGFVYEADFVPWYNTKFVLQYTAFNEFNGGTTAYDVDPNANPNAVAPRSAKDNNSLMLAGWLMY